MNIETGLLVLESVLFLATIILLFFSLKEVRGRKNLLFDGGELEKFTQTA